MSRALMAVMCMVSVACAASISRAQVTEKPKGYKYLSAGAQAIAKEQREAPQEYQRALDAIKEGNEARKKGDDASAYCMYGEAIYRLNLLTDKYPSWNKETVAKQLKNITEVSDKLTAGTCKNLEQMKEAQFRMEVWKREAQISSKLDKLQKTLDDMDREYWDKWDKYIKDIWQRVIGMEQ